MAKLIVEAAYDRAPLASYPIMGLEEALDALHVAHERHLDREHWLPPGARIEILDRLSKLILEREQQLALQAAREGGKPLVDSLVEVRRAAEGVRYAIAHVMTAAGREVPMDLSKASAKRWAATYREPVGVVLAISAFNHPFNLIVHQAVTAVAAGCPVLVKPALSTPMSARSLVELLYEAGLPRDYCQLVLCEDEVAGRLVEDPRVQYLTFIGSAKVGWSLRSRLAPGARCALEHGGVAPAILDETADIDDALPLLVKGGYYHAGQVCVSVQRIYVPEGELDSFVSRFVERTQALRVGDPSLSETEVGPLILPREVERVERWVRRAVEAGGRLACGGERLGETCYAPTVVANPPDDCELSQREIFGPVVAVYGYRNIDEAVARANAPNSYFQASLFTQRLDRALSVSRSLNGTTVLVNDHTAFRVDWMPFGGHRDSGLGTGGIGYSIDDMTLERMVVFRRP